MPLFYLENCCAFFKVVAPHSTADFNVTLRAEAVRPKR